jgi:hypothetical protein
MLNLGKTPQGNASPESFVTPYLATGIPTYGNLKIILVHLENPPFYRSIFLSASAPAMFVKKPQKSNI